jgi:heme A synthase
MADTLQLIHSNLGYLVFLVVLVATFLAFRTPQGAAPVSRLSSLTMVLLDIHVTVGIVFYVVGGWWSAALLKSVAHPVLAIAALAIGHIGLGRARRENSPRQAAVGLAGALVLVTLAIAVVSV